MDGKSWSFDTAGNCFGSVFCAFFSITFTEPSRFYVGHVREKQKSLGVNIFFQSSGNPLDIGTKLYKTPKSKRKREKDLHIFYPTFFRGFRLMKSGRCVSLVIKNNITLWYLELLWNFFFLSRPLSSLQSLCSLPLVAWCYLTFFFLPLFHTQHRYDRRLIFIFFRFWDFSAMTFMLL